MRQSPRAVFSQRPAPVARRENRSRCVPPPAPADSPSPNLPVRCRQELRLFSPSKSPKTRFDYLRFLMPRDGIWRRVRERVAGSWMRRRYDIVENSEYGGEISYTG